MGNNKQPPDWLVKLSKYKDTTNIPMLTIMGGSHVPQDLARKLAEGILAVLKEYDNQKFAKGAKEARRIPTSRKAKAKDAE